MEEDLAEMVNHLVSVNEISGLKTMEKFGCWKIVSGQKNSVIKPTSTISIKRNI